MAKFQQRAYNKIFVHRTYGPRFFEVIMKFSIRICVIYFALQILIASTHVSCVRPISSDEAHKSNCIAMVVQHCFDSGSIICVAISGLLKTTNREINYPTFDMFIQNLMSGEDHSIMVKRANTDKVTEKYAIFEKVHNYLLFVVSEEDFKITVNMIKKYSSWNPHGKFLVYLAGRPTNWTSIVTKIFEYAWQYFVINITILVPDTSISANFTRIITWMPFDSGNCGKESLRFIQVGSCHEGRIFPSPGHVFPAKVC